MEAAEGLQCTGGTREAHLRQLVGEAVTSTGEEHPGHHSAFELSLPSVPNPMPPRLCPPTNTHVQVAVQRRLRGTLAKM